MVVACDYIFVFSVIVLIMMCVCSVGNIFSTGVCILDYKLHFMVLEIEY